MPEEGMTFFLEIDLAAGYITEIIARRGVDRSSGREFDTPALQSLASISQQNRKSKLKKFMPEGQKSLQNRN